MMNDNIDSYWTLGWILTASEKGLFPLIASQEMQKEVVYHYSNANIVVIDWEEIGTHYSFDTINREIKESPNRTGYFFLNFQCALTDDTDITVLNSSRDMLAKTNRNLIFCITRETNARLNKGAYDFSDYFMQKMEFDDEVPSYGAQAKADNSMGVYFEVNYDLPKEQLLGVALSMESFSDEMKVRARFNDALSLLAQVIKIRLENLGEDHPDTASTYTKIGDIYLDKGNYEVAFEYFFKAKNIQEDAFDPNVAWTYDRIASVFTNTGDYEQSLIWFMKAIDVSKRAINPDYFYLAATYNNIGYLYFHLGKFDTALEWYGKYISILNKGLWSMDSDTASTYDNIGECYRSLKQFDVSMTWYQKALDIRERLLGNDHPDTATTYHNIGLLFSNEGEYGKALDQFKVAAKIYKATLGEDHMNTGIAYHSIANILQRQKNYCEAIEYHQKALRVFEGISDSHPYAVDTRRQIEIINSLMNSK